MRENSTFPLLLAVVLCLLPLFCLGKRSVKDWSKMDLDKLEKQWEEGDDDEELMTERQAQFERLERRRQEAKAKAGKFDPRTFGGMSSAQIAAMAAGQKDVAGPTMLFASVGSGGFGEGTDEPISKKATEEVGSRLQQLAQLGSLDVSVYALDAGSVLVSSQRGWEGKEILDFLLSRPEVSKVTWNSQEFFPPKDGEL